MDNSLTMHHVDTRPVFARGESPCHLIDEAIASLIPGQSLIITVPFEPVPLYAKLGRLGFTHESQQLDPGCWQVTFRKPGCEKIANLP